MKIIKIFICILITLFLSGCYNYRELNDLAITTAIGIDRVDNNFRVTAQVVNTQKSSSNSQTSNNTKITTYYADGKTIQEAVRKIVLESPNRIYPYHLEVLIISDDIAKDGIKDSIDVFFRDSELRKQFYVLVAKNTTANNILKILTPIDTIGASKIIKSLNADNKYLGYSELIDFEQLMDNYLNDNIEISIPSIVIKGAVNEGEKIENIEQAESDTSVILNTIGIFKKDKLIGYLSEEETNSFNFIQNNINNTIISSKCDDNNYLTVEITKSDTNIDFKNNEIKINVKGDGKINEINCELNLEKEDTIKQIEKRINSLLENNIMNTVNRVKKDYNSDIFGFEDVIYKNNTKLYKSIKNEWENKYFNNINVKVSANINIIGKGNITKVIYEK